MSEVKERGKREREREGGGRGREGGERCISYLPSASSCPMAMMSSAISSTPHTFNAFPTSCVPLPKSEQKGEVRRRERERGREEERGRGRGKRGSRGEGREGREGIG